MAGQKNRVASRLLWCLCLVGCSKILDLHDGSQQGECSANEDCAPAYACFVGQCRHGCTNDSDCGSEWRCLMGTAQSACIPRDQDCGADDSGCPVGTTCVRSVCRTECSSDAQCAGGQTCSDLGVCLSDAAREPSVSGAGAGNGGSSGSAGGMSEMAGAAGDRTTGGAPSDTTAGGAAGGGVSGGGGASGSGGSGPEPMGGEAGQGTAGSGEPASKPCSPIGCSAAKPICSDGECVAPRSCSVAEICGSPEVSRCCGATAVDGTAFLRDYDKVTKTDDTHPAEVSDFYLDALEVTVGRFRLFVEQGRGTQAAPPTPGSGALHGRPETGWREEWNESLRPSKATLVAELKCLASYQTWTDTAPSGAQHGNENRPINCLTWYEAFAFCAWDGGRLPTEAEWNFAATGGDLQRVYPWSSPATNQSIAPGQASYYVDDTQQCQGDGVVGCAGTDIVVAGSKTGQGRYFNFDLAGNLAEWVMDYYAADYLPSCKDCVQLTASAFRVLRGGASASSKLAVTASSRDKKGPLVRTADQGVRCAYDVPGKD